MTIFPDFENQLVKLASAADGPNRRPRPHRWRRVSGGALTISASILVALGVASIILLGVRGRTGSGPTAKTGGGGSPPPAAWVNAARAAENRTGNHDPACRQHLSYVPHPQRLLYGSPGHSLTSMLGVLRRPAPSGQGVSPRLLHQLRVNARGIYIRYARRGRIDGVTYYLIPAASVNDVGPFPGRCYTEQLNAFRQQVARLPAAERDAAIRYEEQALRTERGLANAPGGVCLITISEAAHGQSCPQTAQLRLTLGAFAGNGGNDRGTVTALVLPDEVAKVTAHYPAEHQVGNVPRPLTVTQRVVDNVVIFNLTGGWDPPSLTYRSAVGAILWSSPHR